MRFLNHFYIVMRTYDAIIIGGGIAGSVAAALLAKKERKYC